MYTGSHCTEIRAPKDNPNCGITSTDWVFDVMEDIRAPLQVRTEHHVASLPVEESQKAVHSLFRASRAAHRWRSRGAAAHSDARTSRRVPPVLFVLRAKFGAGDAWGNPFAVPGLKTSYEQHAMASLEIRVELML
ncbi:hypothetical protein FGB62_157g18 [Gracilaria domingensis]|nr:hypothetical protein FGB62_157g18 [Gracilaria domingensis]